MSVERLNLEWKNQKGNEEQVHKGILLRDSHQGNFFESISGLLNSLNNSDIIPEFPEKYLNLDMKSVKILGFDKELEFVVFKERGKKGIATLIFPTGSPMEFVGSSSQTVVASGRTFLQAFKMFNLDSSKLDDHVVGYVKIEDGKWYVENIYDKNGRGLSEYKEKLRLLNRPVA